MLYLDNEIKYFKQILLQFNLNNFLIYFKDTLCCTGIVRITWPFVRFVTTVNNIDLTLQRDVRPKIQNAGIIKCDIIAKNGIIHEVNEIIRVSKYQKPSWDDFLNE